METRTVAGRRLCAGGLFSFHRQLFTNAHHPFQNLFAGSACDGHVAHFAEGLDLGFAVEVGVNAFCGERHVDAFVIGGALSIGCPDNVDHRADGVHRSR